MRTTKIALLVMLSLTGIYLLGKAGRHIDSAQSERGQVQAAAAVPSWTMKKATSDETKLLVAACGVPKSDTRKPTPQWNNKGITDSTRRKIKYSRLEFWFTEDSADPWTLVGVFRVHDGDTDTTLDRAEIAAAMPCAKDIQFVYHD